MNYTYEKLIEASQLETEIRNSAIVTALDYISTIGLTVNILFKAELSVGDKIILDGLVAAHVPASIPEPIQTVALAPKTLVTPTCPVNEHCMQPWGCNKGCVIGIQNTCAITLTNMSNGGYTFNYTASLPVKVGDYVFQENYSKRNWISAIDTQNQTITFSNERGINTIVEGDGIYSIGKWIDTAVPNWSQVMQLWGVTLSARFEDVSPSSGINDFLEFSIVDLDDLFKNNDVTQALFGVNAADAEPYISGMGFEDNGEYGHWTKYYDESWLVSVDGKQIKSPDGAPGEILAGLYLRLSIFTSVISNTMSHYFIDYYPTSKD